MLPALQAALLLFPPALEIRRLQPAAHLRTKRLWTCLTSSSSPLVMSPTPTTSRRLTSSPTQSSWTRRRSSPTKSSADADDDDAALEGTLREAHRVHSHRSLREDLSVSLSSSSISDRTGRPVEQRNQEAQIRTLLDKQKTATSCRVPSKN